MKKFVLPLVMLLSFNSYALETFTGGSKITAEKLNDNLKEAKGGEICILEEHNVNLSTHFSYGASAGTVFKRFLSKLHGECDFLTIGAESNHSQAFGGTYFTEFKLSQGNYFIEATVVGMHDGQHQTAFFYKGETKAIESISHYSNPDIWGTLHPPLNMRGFVSSTGSEDFSVRFVHTVSGATIHNFQYGTLMSQIIIRKRD